MASVGFSVDAGAIGFSIDRVSRPPPLSYHQEKACTKIAYRNNLIKYRLAGDSPAGSTANVLFYQQVPILHHRCDEIMNMIAGKLLAEKIEKDKLAGDSPVAAAAIAFAMNRSLSSTTGSMAPGQSSSASSPYNLSGRDRSPSEMEPGTATADSIASGESSADRQEEAAG